jgi:hypothetical protein
VIIGRLENATATRESGKEIEGEVERKRNLM